MTDEWLIVDDPCPPGENCGRQVCPRCHPNPVVYDREAHIKTYEGSEFRAPTWPPDKWDLTYWDCGYSWCRVCVSYHRLPECDIEGMVIVKEITA